MISARHASPPILNEKLARNEYRDVQRGANGHNTYRRRDAAAATTAAQFV